jgi:cardiolipin synthase
MADQVKRLRGYSFRNKIQLVRGGKPYFSVLEDLIVSAKDTIHLQCYIYENDDTGKYIANLLKAATAKGVKVFMLLDAYASSALGEDFCTDLIQHGVFFRWFEPLFRNNNFYFGRRLHHKVVVCDGSKALVGGINISDRYNDMPNMPAWLDWAILLEGEAAMELNQICKDFFSKSFKLTLPRRKNKMVSPGFVYWDCAVAIRRNDWVNRYNQISRSYIQMLQKAQKQVIIMSSYFLPGRLIRNFLNRATSRGVEVIVILAGISDVPLSKQAERYMYRWLLRNNITIYEYKKGVLHGKLSMYDGQWATIGSYNVNNISAYASVELNVDVYNKAFVNDVLSHLETIIKEDCIKITKDAYNLQSTWTQRLLQWGAYTVFRISLFLITFYFKQRD